jgi:hypothetical protein
MPPSRATGSIAGPVRVVVPVRDDAECHCSSFKNEETEAQRGKEPAPNPEAVSWWSRDVIQVQLPLATCS